MRVRKLQVKRFTSHLAVAVLLCAASGASAQEYRGSYQDQMACTPDVFRLCGQHIPDSGRITACLRDNVPRLSGPCRAVFKSDTNVASRSADRRNQDADRGPRTYERQGPPQYEQRQYEQRPYEQRAPAPYGRPYYEDDY